MNLRSWALAALVVASPALAADATDRFTAWASRWRDAAEGTPRKTLLAEGRALAEARQAELIHLAQTDPQAALAKTVARTTVPAELAPLVEKPLDAPATFEVLQACDPAKGFAQREHWVRVGEQRYRVAPHGKLLQMPTQAIRARGFTVGGWAVLDESELVPRSNVAQSAWTEGAKKLLYIRVDFPDAPGEPVTQSTVDNSLNALAQYYRDNSYDKTTVTFTVTPVVRMPKSKASYASANDATGLLRDGRAAALAAGFDTAQYDLDVVAFSLMANLGWAGLGFVGNKGAWINGSFGAGVVEHEIGHNFGLSHANFWKASNDTINGPGQSLEYGDVYEVMGSGDGHHNGWYKTNLNWLVAGESVTATSSGTFRLYDLEQRSPGTVRTVNVPISQARSYWVEYRPAAGGNSARGAVIHWGTPQPGEANLLDMQPWTTGASDATLEVGRTFSDRTAGIHITPTALVAGSPGAVDLTVNRGLFASNRAPSVTLAASSTTPAVGGTVTFTATATDPDADPLAYFWDFGDGAASLNQSTFTKSFAQARDVLARVTVTDMKGGTATATVLVKWGSPAGFRVAGRVLEGGVGVEGARVSLGTKVTFTSSSGDYTFTGVPAGSVTIAAVKAGYSMQAGFGNPVQVNGNVMGLNFTATRALFTITGRVSSVGQGLGGVTVSANQYSTVTSSAAGQEGTYTLSGIPAGAYVLSVLAQPGQEFVPQGFTNPVQITTANLANRDFVERVYPVSGEVTGVAGPHTVSDGVRAPVQTTLSGGKWVFTIPRVPPGQWNLVATATGQVITPAFTNPITVVDAARTGLVFNSVAGTAWLIRGRIDEAGAPLRNATVSDGTRTSGTDSTGAFVLVGVPDGPYTLTPAKPGYGFAPATRSVTVAGADQLAQDFTVTNPNAPPIIAVPPQANPSPVAGLATQLTVLGDDPIEGEGALTYTWTQTFGPVPVTLPTPPNGTNAGKSLTLSFTRPGAYAFSVKVADQGGLEANAQVTVLVLQSTARVLVVPGTANVEVGQERQFVAQVRDQFDAGVDFSSDPEWSVTDGGTITATGRFSANSVGDYVVTGTVDGVSGTANVKVSIGPLPRILTGPTVTPSPVTGAVATASVTATDDQGEEKLTYTWTAVNPVAAVTFSPNGTNAAKSTQVTFRALGRYSLQVELADEAGLTTTGFVTVDVVAGPATLTVSPAGATVEGGKTQQYTVEAKDLAGMAATVPPGCVWSVSGAGSIDAASGLFTAGTTDGQGTVKATCGGIEGSTQVTVTAASAAGGGGGTMGGGGCGCSAFSGAPFAFGLFGLLALRRRRAQVR